MSGELLAFSASIAILLLPLASSISFASPCTSLAALSGLSGAEAVTQRLRKVRFWAVRNRRFQEQAREAMRKAGIA